MDEDWVWKHGTTRGRGWKTSQTLDSQLPSSPVSVGVIPCCTLTTDCSGCISPVPVFPSCVPVWCGLFGLVCVVLCRFSLCAVPVVQDICPCVPFSRLSTVVLFCFVCFSPEFMEGENVTKLTSRLSIAALRRSLESFRFLIC